MQVFHKNLKKGGIYILYKEQYQPLSSLLNDKKYYVSLKRDIYISSENK